MLRVRKVWDALNRLEVSLQKWGHRPLQQLWGLCGMG